MHSFSINLPAYNPERDDELIHVTMLVGPDVEHLTALALVNEPGSSFEEPRTRLRRYPADSIVYASHVADARKVREEYAKHHLAELGLVPQPAEAPDGGEVPGVPVPRRLA